MLKPRTGLFNKELNSLKRMESTDCVIKVVLCKLADAKDNMDSLVDSFRQGIFDPFASIRPSVDQLLAAVNKHMEENLVRDAVVLQQSVHNSLCRSAVLSKSHLSMPPRLRIEILA